MKKENSKNVADKEEIQEEIIEEASEEDVVENIEKTDSQEENEAPSNEPISEETEKLSQLEAEYSALEDRYLRVQAEMTNMKRIHQREKQDSAKYRSQSLATELLEVIDNLERAVSVETSTEEAASIKKGVELVISQFKSAFEKESISVIDPLNEPFDPNFHQAVSMMPASDDQDSETVVNVLQKGYKLNDRVLRPAMVIVAQ